jgi:predicted O-methyltransferase YrrM
MDRDDRDLKFIRAVGPDPTPVQREMEDRAREDGFPILGPELGGMVTIFARMVGAERVFEFGSGFGYSASWFLRGLPETGHVVLTEIDPDEAELGREYVDRMGDLDRVTYEVGDALDAIERYDGPFDVVLVDHQKDRYVDAFEAVREKVPRGGLVIADNIVAGPADFDDVFAGVVESETGFDERTRGLVDYVEHVRSAPDFISTVVPVRSGLALSYRTG